MLAAHDMNPQRLARRPSCDVGLVFFPLVSSRFVSSTIRVFAGVGNLRWNLYGPLYVWYEAESI